MLMDIWILVSELVMDRLWMEQKEITYGYICPNVSQVSFANINKFRNNFNQNAEKVRIRKGGKYISQ